MNKVSVIGMDRETKKSIGKLNIPKSIGKMKHLERIATSPEIGLEDVDPVQIGFKCLWNDNLTKLPKDFCLLQSLKDLVLRGGSEMKSLPECFGNLTNLRYIDMPRCNELERLPDSFGELVQLQYLNLESCHNLTTSNETLGRIRTLEYVNLSRCWNIEVFPPQVAHQRSLEQLHFGGTNLKIKEMPSFGELSDLEVLNIGGPLLDTLLLSLCILKNLKQLGLYDCGQLKCFPDSLGDLRSLMTFWIDNCRELKCFTTSIGQLTELTRLHISYCPLICELPFKKEVKGERETSSDLEPSIDNCILSWLQWLYVQTSWISEVSFVEELEEFPGIETLVSLNAFSASQCVNLKSIRGLGQLTKFRDLYISGCSELEEVEGIQDCMSLYKVSASRCPKLQWNAGVVEQLRQRVTQFWI